MSKDSRQKKIEKLRATIHDSRSSLGSFLPIPLPLDAHYWITGINAESSSIFKSSLSPLKLDLITTDNSTYPVIFKNGDDLRQDQLVIQLFTLMDKLLRQENLDLKLMPYRVLATGAVDGMVQFVPSKTLGAISSEFGTVINFLKQHHADEGSVGTYGVAPSVLDTYIKSCGKWTRKKV
jgi:phosphatidylinositol 3-kinase